MKLFAVVDRLLLGVLRVARALLGLALFGGAMLLAVVLALRDGMAGARKL